ASICIEQYAVKLHELTVGIENQERCPRIAVARLAYTAWIDQVRRPGLQWNLTWIQFLYTPVPEFKTNRTLDVAKKTDFCSRPKRPETLENSFALDLPNSWAFGL